jgi:hypothetical protein
MEARSLVAALLTILFISSSAPAQLFVGPQSVVQTANFRVYARNQQLAAQVAQVAEENRKKLAIHWLGSEIPNWPKPCPLRVQDGSIPASGETKYVLIPGGGVADFEMMVSGTAERILDSVLPHEITHTVMASHFAALGKPVPRWADEGACTTVEHSAERSKHDHMLVQFLMQGKGIPFATLFTLKDYPAEILPLYAHGYSLTSFLIAQGGPRHFIQFLERGMESEDWVAAIEEYYHYPKLGKLQTAWINWVSGGGGEIAAYTADAMGVSKRSLASRTVATGESDVLLARARQSDVQPPMRAVALNNVGSPGNPNAIAPNATASRPLNQLMHLSSGSYYLDQLHRNQPRPEMAANSAQDSFVPAARRTDESSQGTRSIPHSVSQPAPFQTMGGTLIR